MTKKRKGGGKKRGALSTGDLNPMQRAFVSHFVANKNATEAAKKAGYSEKTAGQIGYQLLQISSIREAIREKFKIQDERLDLSATRVLLEIFRLATVDIGQAYDETGNLKPIHEIPEDVRRAIVAIETEKTVTVPPGYGSEDSPSEDGEAEVTKKVKFADKNRALEMLAKHYKLLTERLEVEGKIGLESLIAGSNDAGPEES